MEDADISLRDSCYWWDGSVTKSLCSSKQNDKQTTKYYWAVERIWWVLWHGTTARRFVIGPPASVKNGMLDRCLPVEDAKGSTQQNKVWESSVVSGHGQLAPPPPPPPPPSLLTHCSYTVEGRRDAIKEDLINIYFVLSFNGLKCILQPQGNGMSCLLATPTAYVWGQHIRMK